MLTQTPLRSYLVRWLRSAGAIGVVFSLVAAPASAAAAEPGADGCPAPGFAALIASVGAATVGSCLGTAYSDPASQASMQPTTGGLLVASTAGDWTAFTDGSSTWVDGPSGVVRQAGPLPPATSPQPQPTQLGQPGASQPQPSQPSTAQPPAIASTPPEVQASPSLAAAKRVHLLRQRSSHVEPHAALSSQTAAASQSQLLYYGGAVERSSSTNFAIYWQPAGSYMSSQYTSLINRFFSDLGSSAFYGLLTQYTDRSGQPIANVSSFGGAWTDTSAYPSTISNDCGGRSSCLGDDDVQNEVKKAIQANGWPLGGNNNYLVFTARGEVTCDPNGECSDTAYCGYHSNFTYEGADVRYANMPYAQVNGCDSGSYPNGDQDADVEINITSHETFETVTDPDVGYGWVDALGYEIGDKCAFNFGSLNAQGGNVLLNGHTYLVQQEWSNAASGCALSTGLPLSVALAGAGSGTVSSSPSGISCPGTCSTGLPSGSTVTLTASPNAGSLFAGWSGACSGTGACSISLSAARNVTATFNLAPVCTPRPPIAVTATPLGGGQLQVTVSTSGTGVSLQSLQFGAASNALISIGSTVGSTGSQSVPLAAGTTSAAFTLQRSAAGAATTVPLTVTDSCGAWPTFVGGGPTAF